MSWVSFNKTVRVRVDVDNPKTPEDEMQAENECNDLLRDLGDVIRNLVNKRVQTRTFACRIRGVQYLED